MQYVLQDLSFFKKVSDFEDIKIIFDVGVRRQTKVDISLRIVL